MVKHRILASVLLLMTLVECVATAQKQPPREYFGVRPGMSEDAVRRRLRKIATQEKKEREEGEGGEQEVWILKRDSRFKYLVTWFTKDHRLSWLAIVAHPQRVRYADIGSLELATKATDGINYSYKWKLAATRREPALLVIARGSSSEFLTSYSVYHSR